MNIRPATLIALTALLAVMPPVALAQDSSSLTGGKSDNKSIYKQYYSSVESLNAEHRQKLAEIDERYGEAMRAYSKENARRSQALVTDHNAAHEALAKKGLSGPEKDAEYRKIREDDTRRRKEHAEWRDATTSKLNEEYRSARKAQIDIHREQTDRVLADRNSNLVRARAAGEGVGLSSGAAASLGGSGSDDGSAAAAGQEHLERGDGSHIAEAGTDNTPGADDGSDDASVLTRDNESEAGISSRTDSVTTASAGHKGEKKSPGMAGGIGRSRLDAPVRDKGGEYFEYGDGARVRAAGPDGSVGKINDKGDIVYGDGTTIVHTGDQEVTIHKPDGSSTTRRVNDAGEWETTDRRSGSDYTGGSGIDAPVRDTGGEYFEYGDGARVRAAGPDGSIGKISDKGDIVYGDGTTVVHTGDQEVTVHRPDGSSTTRRVDDDGQWQTVGHNKPYSAGSGSNDKYGSGSGAGGSSSSGSASGSSGGGSSGGSGSSDESSDSDDGGKDSGDSSSGNDSDESGSAEGDSSDSGSSESGEDADTEGEGKEYYGNSGSGRQTGPSDVVQGIVDRATGQSTEVQTGVPEPCSESGGFGVTQPGPGGTGSCVPGHLPTISEENDRQPDTPDAGSSADAEDTRRAGGTDIGGRITQPGLGQDGIMVADLPSQSGLDQAPVVNPGDVHARSAVVDDSSQGPIASGGGIDLGGTVDLDRPGDEIIANANPDQQALRERLFNEEVERRRRAEEEAASRLNFIQTTQARAHTTASASSRRRQPNCETNPDADGDGVDDVRCGGADCDDSNPNRYPGNTEIGDASHMDEDCNPSTFGSVDEDGDGFFSAMHCNSDGVELKCGNDCDDSEASVHPGAAEVCNYIDDNCDSEVDKGVLATKYLDRDDDWYGDPAAPLFVCAQTYESPSGDGDWLSERGTDCDDTDPAIWQGCSQ